MAPIIEVDNETIQGFNQLGISYTPRPDLEQPLPKRTLPENLEEDYRLIPTLNLWVAKKRTHLGESWNNTQDSLSNGRSRMPEIPEFIGTVIYLRTQEDEEARMMLDEMTGRGGLWRAEHLDAYFEERDGELYILTKNKTCSKKLEPCLMKDCEADVFGSANSQGLPTREGDVSYGSPRDGCVARFDTNRDWSSLHCDRDSACRLSPLGVREVIDAV